MKLKIMNLLVKLFVCAFGLALTSRIIVDLSVHWRFRCFDHLIQAGATGVILLGGVLLWQWIIKAAKDPSCKSSRLINKGLRFIQELPPFGLISLNLILIGAFVYSIHSLVWYGGRAIAYVADSVGAYEFGERIYSQTPRSGDTSLASVCGAASHDSNLEELKGERLNHTVAQIYGSQSREMANRYLILGFHYENNFHNYAAAEQYFEKSLLIYRRIDDQVNCVKVLSFLSFAQYQNGEKAKVKQTLGAALQAIAVCPNRQELNNFAAALWAVARSTGNRELAGQFFPNTRAVRICS